MTPKIHHPPAHYPLPASPNTQKQKSLLSIHRFAITEIV